MAKTPTQLDVLVLGDHPCAYLATAILGENKSIKVGQSAIPDEPLDDRLVTINPAFFELHALLSPLKSKLKLEPIYGLKFLGNDAATSSAHVDKTIGAYIGEYKQIRAEMMKLSRASGAKFYQSAQLQIRHLDETGAQVEIDGAIVHAKLLILAGELAPEQKRMIGLPPLWDEQILRRWTFLRIDGAISDKKFIPMSLDLGGTMHWAWLLPGNGEIQISIEQIFQADEPAENLLRKWIDVLLAHRIIEKSEIDFSAAISLNLPLAGALSQEGVANRTLLIGPAGGFYTACAEDIYPNCWSAICAANVAKNALTQRHVQDALQEYHQQWGATLGDYLRGPQENLKFLLPLVYRNSTMTARLAEAILSGKSVVR
jgi:flavin-dependent dehydrogenase